MTTTSNFDELAAVQRSALINELIDKTNRCALQWTQLAPGQYTVSYMPYDLYLTQSGLGIYALDVFKNASRFRTYLSNTQSEVADLYMTVDRKGPAGTPLDKMKTFLNALAQAPTCSTQFFFETASSNGVLGAGSAPVVALQPVSSFMRPNALSYGPSPFPWAGTPTNTYQDIADPSVPANDGDASYIFQQVSGIGPTNWGFAFAGFDLSGAGTLGPYLFDVRAAFRDFAGFPTNLVLDVMANNTVIFTQQTPTNNAGTYIIYDSGLQPMPYPLISSLTNLQVRLSQFTNAGNTSPITLRVTAVDITVYGYNPG